MTCMSSRRTSTAEKDRDTVSQMQGSELKTAVTKSPVACEQEERGGMRNDRDKVYGSVERQNVLILSILLASLCGCFNALTLICSLPAVMASVWVRSDFEGVGNGRQITWALPFRR